MIRYLRVAVFIGLFVSDNRKYMYDVCVYVCVCVCVCTRSYLHACMLIGVSKVRISLLLCPGGVFIFIYS